MTRRQLGGAALVGLLLLLCGNGGVAVAEQTVPSGIAALLVAATPLWLVVLRRVAGDRVARLTLAGTALGFVGIAVLVLPGGLADEDGTAGRGLGADRGDRRRGLLGGRLVRQQPDPDAGGRLRRHHLGDARRRRRPGPGRSGAGEQRGFAVSEVSGEAWAWLAYLVVVGSLVAFSAYVWLLQHAPISLTATYAYVNPVVAVLLGALVLDEPIAAAVVGGGAIVVLGVGLVVSSERPRRPEPQPVGSGAEVVDTRR